MNKTTIRMTGLATILAGGLGLASCCGELRLGLDRLSDFFSGVFDLSLDISLEGYIDVDFEGSLGDLSGVVDFDASRVDVEIDIMLGLTAREDAIDLDGDGVAETVLRIHPVDFEINGRPLIYIIWQGDSFTIDEEVCYLGWGDGARTNIAAGRCGADTGTMYCTAPADDPEAFSCERCDAGQPCVPCAPDGALGDCLPPKPASGGGSFDIDIDIDADADFGIDRDPESIADEGCQP